MATTYPHSIPTPPFSPQNYRMPDEHTENPLKSTINLLDSLVAFYQHERMWVYRTRAMLEEAFPSPEFMQPTKPSGQEQSIMGHHNGDQHLHVQEMLLEASSMNNSQPPATRWMRRKKGFKLRLDGLRTGRRVITTQSPEEQEQQHDQIQSREQILEMFEKMMESRMESCQRVNKLVREANRATLHDR
ncbi:hypothetical protein BJ165DRAFT_1422475 [Panaeolus papilionaceus]|nr:hypothetical protein BJ165DRAFT_1422475 [Panaeolus papilionaceus]